ncbi:ATP-binding protein [Shewanella sp. GXUN23E]|uniref:ATP-binding protein n=1 Tax=Shewanella sp. GXUN23E TaxID=3422498 RepID=UPI003D7E96B1
MYSLRLWLAILMVVGVGLSVVVAGWFSTRDATNQVEELFDAQMLQTAKLLERIYTSTPIPAQRRGVVLPVDETEVETFVEDREATQLAYEQKLAFMLASAQGEPLLSTGNLPFSAAELMRPGYRKLHDSQGNWHVFGYFSPSQHIWIVTAQQDEVRRELVEQIVRNALLTPWLIIPLILILMLWLSDLLLHPIQALAKVLSGRKADQLEPINIQLPKELLPVGKALNAYIARCAAVLVRERQFSADAAHELKTPLALVRLHQNALQELLKEDPQAQEHLMATEHGVVRMTHMVEQLLLLSRLDSLAQLDERARLERLPVEALVGESLNGLLHIIADYQWQLTIDPALRVKGQQIYLQIVLSNLIENACKYSPLESQIDIVAHRADEHNSASEVVICIADRGRGMTEAELERASERFFRVDKHNIDGAGLGLSICHKILALHGGHLEMRPRQGGGLEVRIYLPGTGD